MVVKPNLVKDKNAGEVKIPKLEYNKEKKAVEIPEVVEEPKVEETPVEIINTPMGTTTVEIVPGKKVTVIGKDGIFIIGQKLNDGRVSLFGDEGLRLYVKPEDIRNIK